MFHKEIQGDREGELNSLSEFTERVPSSVFFFDWQVNVSIFSSVRIGFSSPELWLFRLRVSNLGTYIIFTFFSSQQTLKLC